MLSVVVGAAALAATSQAGSVRLQVATPESLVVGKPCRVSLKTSARGIAVLQERRGKR